MTVDSMILKIKYPDVPDHIVDIIEHIKSISVYEWEYRKSKVYEDVYSLWHDDFYIRIFDDPVIVYDSCIDAEENDLDYVLSNAEMHIGSRKCQLRQ